MRSSVNFLYSSLISPKVTVWSNGTYSLLLNGTDEEDFALLLDCCVTLEEDFTELLDATLEEDFALELDCGVTLEEDFAELLDATLEEDFTLLLDFALELDFALTEEEDLAELLDTLVSSSLDCGVTSSILLDDSSSRGAKLLSSSQAESANRDVTERAKSFACKLKIMIVLLSSKYK